MSRLSGLILSIGLIAAVPAANAHAIESVTGKPAAGQEVLLAHAKPRTERQKCQALNRCRSKYTACFEKLEAQHRIAEKDKVCVPPYQECINANFSGFDFVIQRWVTPGYIDCSKYPG